MIRRPPRSTLFPYNDALPISDSPMSEAKQLNVGLVGAGVVGGGVVKHLTRNADLITERLGMRIHLKWVCDKRSEEHTSELQSHSDLVCRLLLVKKRQELVNTV